MFVRVDGLRVAYDARGDGPPVCLLHGWGGESGSFFPVAERLASSYRVFSLDFPGFGKSALPTTPWGVTDYARLVAGWMDAIGAPAASLIGHSFGGRVAIRIAADQPHRAPKLVLVDSAGILPRRGLSYHVRVWTAKAGRRVLALPALARARPTLEQRLYRALGASDYAAAGPLRATFVRVVNEDLEPLLPRIQAPTLLVWGGRDEATPVTDGKRMAQRIPDARLVVYPEAGHFSYLDRRDDFCAEVERFLASRS